MMKGNGRMHRDFIDGMKASVVFGAAFIPLYLAIGIAGQQAGRTFAETLGMTLLLFSTPLQFLLTQSRDNFLVLVPIILIMNARFLLFAASLVPFLGNTSRYKLVPSLIMLCPSVFSGCLARFQKIIEKPFHYFIGLGLPIWGISIVCTVIGFSLAGNISSPFWDTVLKLVLPLQFTMLAAKHWGENVVVASYGLGFCMAPLMYGWLGGIATLATPVFIGLVALLLEEQLSRGKRIDRLNNR